VISELQQHPLKKMLDLGVVATVNSDDPAYFGGYLNENYLQVARALDLSPEEIARLAKNSFMASFTDEDFKQKNIRLIDSYLNDFSFKSF
jgi:adenosine deaminase